MKAYYAVLLALVLIVGGAKVLSGQNGNATDAPVDGPDVSEGRFGLYDTHHPDHGVDHEHHDHYQPPPLVEMLPPIGPAGSVVAIGAMAQYLLNRTINRIFEQPRPSVIRPIEPQTQTSAIRPIPDEAVSNHPPSAANTDHHDPNHKHSHDHDGHGEGGDGHGGGEENLLEPKDDPEELVAIVGGNDPDAANRSVVVNPKGTQGKRYIVVEVYMQRSEPKDIRFKERAGEKTKRLQEIVTSELESKTIEDLQKPVTKEFIRRTIQKKFNGVLATKEVPAPVGKIVFSKWIMQ